MICLADVISNCIKDRCTTVSRQCNFPVIWLQLDICESSTLSHTSGGHVTAASRTSSAATTCAAGE